MKTETYKGIDIMHSADKNKFYTKVFIRKRTSGRIQPYISASKIEKVKSEIDLFIKSISAKAGLKKAWLKDCYADGGYKLVDIILYDSASNSVTIRNQKLKITTIPLSEYKFNNDKIFINSKYNNALVNRLNAKQFEIDVLKQQKNSLKEKMVPVKAIYF